MKLLFFILVSSFFLYSQEDNIDDLMEMSLEDLLNMEITSATKKSQKLSEAPAIIDIVSGMEIKDKGYQSVAEAVQSLPGLFMTTDYVTDNVAIRGINGGFKASSRIIKVMINGQPTSFRPTSENFLGAEMIPMSMVKQIEVIRGPASALYGANAFLGIINIITKSADKDAPTLNVVYRNNYSYNNEVNTLGGIDISLQHQFSETTHLIAAVSASESDRSTLKLPFSTKGLEYFVNNHGFKQSAFDAQTADDMSKPMSAYANFKTEFADMKATTELSYQSLNNSARFYELNPILNTSVVHMTNWYVKQSLNTQRIEKLDLTASLAVSGGEYGDDDKLDKDHPEADKTKITKDKNGKDSLVIVSEGSTIQRHQLTSGIDFAISGDYQLSENYNLLIGFDYSVDTHEHLSYTTETRLTKDTETVKTHSSAEDAFKNLGAYAQSILNLNDQTTLTLGLRLDDHNIYGQETNYRAGLVYAFSDALYGKLLYGTSYRAPTASQLYSAETPYHQYANVGNKDLKPENAQTVEFSTGYSGFENISFQLNGYFNKLENLIVYRQNLETGFLEPKNADQIDSWGYEFITNWASQQFNGKIGVSFQNSEVDKSSTQKDGNSILINSSDNHTSLYPTWLFNTSTNYSGNKFVLNFETYYASDYRASELNADENSDFGLSKDYKLDGYFFINTTLSSRAINFIPDHQTFLKFKVRNMFNNQYKHPGFFQYDIPDIGRVFTFTIQQNL